MMRLACVSGLILLGLSGCQEVYQQFCTEERHRIDCLKAVDDDSKVVLERYFSIPETPECPFRFKALQYELTSCNNPKAKAMGSDFDGYVRLEVFYEGACYYRIQQDYKSETPEDLVVELTTILKERLALP